MEEFLLAKKRFMRIALGSENFDNRRFEFGFSEFQEVEGRRSRYADDDYPPFALPLLHVTRAD